MNISLYNTIWVEDPRIGRMGSGGERCSLVGWRGVLFGGGCGVGWVLFGGWGGGGEGCSLEGVWGGVGWVLFGGWGGGGEG